MKGLKDVIYEALVIGSQGWTDKGLKMWTDTLYKDAVLGGVGIEDYMQTRFSYLKDIIGLTDSQIAKHIGVSRVTIHNWRKNPGAIRVDDIKKIESLSGDLLYEIIELSKLKGKQL